MGAGRGTTCRPRTRRRSRSTSAARAAVLLGGGCAAELGLLLAYLWMTLPVHADGRQLGRQRRARGAARARRAARGVTAGRARRARRARRADQVRAARAGAAVRRLPAAAARARLRARRSPAVARRWRWRRSTSPCCGSARSASSRTATRRSRSGGSTSCPTGSSSRRRSLAVAFAVGVAFLPRRRDVGRARRAGRRGADRAPARGRPLVLPLPGLVRPARVGRAARSAGRRTCSIESARRGRDARISTALIHGSSSAES